MKKLIIASLLIGAATTAPSFASTIAGIETQSSGTSVTLDSDLVITAIGTVPGSADGYTYTDYAILAEDATGSIDLFGHLPTGDTYIPSVGDEIEAAGTYSPFDSIPEIDSLTSLALVSSGNAVPAAVPVSTSDLAGITVSSFNYLGHYLSLDNVEFSAASGINPFPATFPFTPTEPIP